MSNAQVPGKESAVLFWMLVFSFHPLFHYPINQTQNPRPPKLTRDTGKNPQKES
jgi:hypothetical protein